MSTQLETKTVQGHVPDLENSKWKVYEFTGSEISKEYETWEFIKNTAHDEPTVWTGTWSQVDDYTIVINAIDKETANPRMYKVRFPTRYSFIVPDKDAGDYPSLSGVRELK